MQSNRNPFHIAMFCGALYSAASFSHGVDNKETKPSYESKRPPQNAAMPAGKFDPQAVEGVVDQFKLWQAGSKLTVCFMDGDARAKKLVADTADSMVGEINLKLDFGAPNFRSCNASQNAHVRISFDATAGNWSNIGTDSNRIDQAKASMNLADLSAASFDQVPATQRRGVVLHEFGHALALQHEHQSPEAKCDGRFDWTKIYSIYAQQYGWDKAKVDLNMRSLQASDRLRTTSYDKRSIMHYYFPEWMFLEGKSSTCFVDHNFELSQTDRAVLASSYPSSGAAQVAEVNRRGDFAKTVLKKILTTPEQAEWASKLVKRAAATALPSMKFNISSTTNTGTCAGGSNSVVASGSAVTVQCTDAKGNITIGAPEK